MPLGDPDVPDVEAFAALYREHRAPLYAFCLARTRDPALAEDIVQEVFAKAFVSRARYQAGKPFWPWIASIAARTCIGDYRRRACEDAHLAELATRTTEPADMTVAAVLRHLDRRGLERDLAALPARQRTALRLFAVDGWSYADIAEHLGQTVGSVKALIVRARTRLRESRERAWVAVVGAGRAAQARLRRLTAQVHVAVSTGIDVLRAWSHALAVDAAAVSLVVAALSGALIPAAPEAGATRGVAAPPELPAPARTSPPADDRVAAVGMAGRAPAVVAEPATRQSVGTAERTAHQAVASALAPAGLGSTAVAYTDMAVSPGYERRPTILVAGKAGLWGMPSLVVSHDGGASWARPRAAGLLGTEIVRLLLPPRYPEDDRIFAVTWNGLLVSRDSGDSFETLLTGLPSVYEASMSPGFNDGDPSILLGTFTGVVEYRDDDPGAVRSVAVAGDVAMHAITSLAHVPGDAGEPAAVLVVGSGYGSESTVARCTRPTLLGGSTLSELRCTTVRRQYWQVRPRFRPASNEPGVVYLVADDVAVSRDGGRTFLPLGLPRADGSSIFVAGVVDTGRSALVAQSSMLTTGGQFSGFGPFFLHTEDEGHTWGPLSIGVPGFESGAFVLAATPTGRIIAGGLFGSIACSVDGGRTWTPVCPTPDM